MSNQDLEIVHELIVSRSGSVTSLRWTNIQGEEALVYTLSTGECGLRIISQNEPIPVMSNSMEEYLALDCHSNGKTIAVAERSGKV